MTELRFNRERLASLMQLNEMNDTDVAEKVGVSRQMIFYLRKGKRKTTTAEVIKKLSDLFGVTVEYLLTDEEGAPTPQPQMPALIRQLSQAAERLPPARQEELLRMAHMLETIEKERSAAQPDHMVTLLQIEEQLTIRGGNEDLLRLLRTLAANGGRVGDDTGNDTGEPADDPS